MPRFIAFAGSASVVAFALLAGCANGTEEDDSLAAAVTDPTGAAPAPGASGSGSSSKPSGTSAPKDEGKPEKKADDGMSSSGAAGGGGVPSAACNAPKTCANATDLGTLSGDQGADTLSASGSTSEWLKVRVAEGDNMPFAKPLTLTVALTSPSGSNFDVYVYVPSNDTLECSAVAQQATSQTGLDMTSVSFGETGLFANLLPDDRTVTIEVRHVSGTCAPTKKWTLTVSGNE